MKNLAKHKTLLKTREYIVQAIFQLLFNSQNSETIIEQFLHEHKNKKFEEDFFSSTLKNIENKINDYENKLSDIGISNKNIDLIDKSILFYAFSEFDKSELDKPLIIDESVRLSKKFSSPEAYKFINAKLDKLLNPL